MTKFYILIVAGLLALVALVLSVSSIFNIEELEGNTEERKKNVKWAFEEFPPQNNFSQYVLLQRKDTIRGKPIPYVDGIFWIENNKFIKVNDLSEKSLRGEECFDFSVANYSLQCSSDSRESFDVCDASFLQSASILTRSPDLDDLEGKYDEIVDFYSRLPTTKNSGKKYNTAELSKPITKYIDNTLDEQINCWAVKQKTARYNLSGFLCDDTYHKCEFGIPN